jgi:hypothetical protein
MHSHSGQWRGDRQCFARLAACGNRPEPPRRAHRPLQAVMRRERTGARSTVKFVHNVRPPVPGIRLRGRFSIQIAPHGPGGAASDIGISEPLGEDGDRDAAWPLGPDPGKITPVTCPRIVALRGEAAIPAEERRCHREPRQLHTVASAVPAAVLGLNLVVLLRIGRVGGCGLAVAPGAHPVSATANARCAQRKSP